MHEKPLEYFCFDEVKEICQTCIIFGDHKNHIYCEKSNYEKVLIKEREKLQQELKKEF